MKNLILTSVVLLFSFSGIYAQKNVEKLPQTTKDFIKTNFPSEKITRMEKEKDLLDFGNEDLYEVVLENGIKMDFNKAGELTEINSRNGVAIPEGTIPANINSYVQKNYPGLHITSWEVDNNDQEVELSDGTDLEFDSAGKFLWED